ncbi:MAG: hypothetical protein U1F43_16140 [Myxococcota bacterium]
MTRAALARAALVACALAVAGPALAEPTPLPTPANAAEAKTRYEAARTAYKAHQYYDAALAYDAAHAFFKDATLLWNAGRAWERSGELDLAKDRFTAFLAEGKVDPEQRKEAAEALVRIGGRLAARDTVKPGPDRMAMLESDRAEAEAAGNAPLAARLADELAAEKRRWDEAHRVDAPPPPAPSHTLEWVLVGTGGALAAGGLVLGLVGQGQLDDITAAQDAARRAGDPVVVTSLTRAEAADQQSSGKTLRTLGFVAGGVGVAAAVTGLVALLVDDGPTVEGTTGVTAAPLAGGGLVTWTAAF